MMQPATSNKLLPVHRGTATPPNLHAAPSQGRRERGREAEMGGSGK
ncbi:hypothetical protein Alg215_05738 [Pyrenophora tritici-repentis]|nr:hypothetical protein Alg215_05738 [Pyrenophora tritici-repentis]